MSHELTDTRLWSQVIMCYALPSIGKYVPRVYGNANAFQIFMGKRFHVITVQITNIENHTVVNKLLVKYEI